MESMRRRSTINDVKVWKNVVIVVDILTIVAFLFFCSMAYQMLYNVPESFTDLLLLNKKFFKTVFILIFVLLIQLGVHSHPSSKKDNKSKSDIIKKLLTTIKQIQIKKSQKEQ